MPAKQTTPAPVKAYLDTLPPDRREIVEAIRTTINANIDPAFTHGVQYKMPAWFLSHEAYPPGYHCDPSQPLPFASVANQKNAVSIYLFCLYQDDGVRDRFVDAWKATGRKLDMGKSCIRVKTLDDVPLDVLGKAIKKATAKDFVARYEAILGDRAPAKKPAATKTTTKAATTKKVSRKKTSSKP
jgi:hypothetical protein